MNKNTVTFGELIDGSPLTDMIEVNSSSPAMIWRSGNNLVLRYTLLNYPYGNQSHRFVGVRGQVVEYLGPCVLDAMRAAKGNIEL